jgi:hypothetical protein
MPLPAPFLTQFTAMVEDLEVSTSGELIERLGFSDDVEMSEFITSTFNEIS